MKRSRRGSMFLEACMSLAVLAAAFVAVAQLTALVAQQRQALEQRRWATREAANLMERIMARPWDELTPEQLAPLAESLAAERSLRGGQVAIEVLDHEQPAAREVRVRIAWRNPAQQVERPVELIAWKHRLQVER